MRRALAVLACLGCCWSVSCAHGIRAPGPGAPKAPARPQAPAAAAEPGKKGEPAPPADRSWASPQALEHYLQAQLALGAGDLAAAGAELRRALLFDPDSAHLHVVLAEVLAQQEQTGAAQAELRAALAREPDHGPAHRLAGQLAHASGDGALARAELRAALTADPLDAEAARELVRIEAEENAFGVALEVAQRFADAVARADGAAAGTGAPEGRSLDRLRGAAAQTFADVALAAAEAEDEPHALEGFARARAVDPSDPAVVSAQIGYLESRRQFAAARALVQERLGREPDAADALAGLARLFLDSGDAAQAREPIGRLLQMAEDLPAPSPEALHSEQQSWQDREDDRRVVAAALLEAGGALLNARRSALALRAAQAALRLLPQKPELLLLRAQGRLQLGEASCADGDLARVEAALSSGAAAPGGVAFPPAEPRTFAHEVAVERAVAEARAGAPTRARRRLIQLLREDPLDESTALALVDVDERRGRLPAAVAWLQKASAAHPDSAGPLFALAAAAERAGQGERAVALERRVLALEPRHAGALNAVGYTLAQDGGAAQLAEAEQLLTRAATLRPEDGAIADSLGLCLLRLGRTNDALAELRRAAGLAPGDPVVLLHLGDAQLAAGSRDEAARSFRESVRALQSARSARTAAARPAGVCAGPEPRGTRSLDKLDPADPAEALGPAEARHVRAELLRRLQALTAR